MPQFNALFGVSFLLSLNILTVFVATEAIIGSEYLVSTPNSEYYAGAMLIVVGLVSYFLLVHNEKYKKIAEEFKKERPTQKRKRMILIWLYIMGSFAVNLFSVWLAY